MIEPGAIAGTKPGQRHLGPAEYAELWEQFTAGNAKSAGPSGGTAREVVATAIVGAIEDPATPFRVPSARTPKLF